MKITIELPDEAGQAVRETLEWLDSRAFLSSGEVLVIHAGGDSRDCPLRFRMTGLEIVPAEAAP